MKDYYENIKATIKRRHDKTVKIGHFFDADEEIMNPSDLDITNSHVMIFDYVQLEDQTTIKKYFYKGNIITSMYFIYVNH